MISSTALTCDLYIPRHHQTLSACLLSTVTHTSARRIAAPAAARQSSHEPRSPPAPAPQPHRHPTKAHCRAAKNSAGPYGYPPDSGFHCSANRQTTRTRPAVHHTTCPHVKWLKALAGLCHSLGGRCSLGRILPFLLLLPRVCGQCVWYSPTSKVLKQAGWAAGFLVRRPLLG